MGASTKVAVLMGSTSDKDIMAVATATLAELGCESEEMVMSAHRNPDQVAAFARDAKANGFSVIIAGAGKAAHLPGVIAAYTPLPVIGVPIETKDLGGMDSLLSIVQMPKGIPVATVAINGAANAAILAGEIIALSDEKVAEKISEFRSRMGGGS